jgi:hypothetical protein
MTNTFVLHLKEYNPFLSHICASLNLFTFKRSVILSYFCSYLNSAYVLCKLLIELIFCILLTAFRDGVLPSNIQLYFDCFELIFQFTLGQNIILLLYYAPDAQEYIFSNSLFALKDCSVNNKILTLVHNIIL